MSEIIVFWVIPAIILVVVSVVHYRYLRRKDQHKRWEGYADINNVKLSDLINALYLAEALILESDNEKKAEYFQVLDSLLISLELAHKKGYHATRRSN